MQQNSTKISSYIGLLIGWLMVLICMLLVYFYRDTFALKYTYRGIITVLSPMFAICSGNLTEKLINCYVAGRYSYMAQIVATKLGWGVGIFLFFFHSSLGYSWHTASYGILMLSILYISMTLCLMYQSYIIHTTIAKAFIYMARGAVIKWMSVNIWDDGVWEIGITISFSDIMLFGYVFLGLCTLLSLLQLSENIHLKAAGKWLGSSPNVKLVIGMILTFVIGDIRIQVMEQLPEQYDFIEWLIFAAIMFTAIIVLYVKVQAIAEVNLSEDLQKHVQNVQYVKGQKFSEASASIDLFVNAGEKSRLLTFIVQIGDRSGIPSATISNIISPLVQYRDPYQPAFAWRSEMDMVDEKNRNVRISIVEDIIRILHQLRR